MYYKKLKNLLKKISPLMIIFYTLFFINCKQNKYESAISKPSTMNTEDQKWKEKLTPEEYYVLREKGTERPHTGKYNDFFEKGYYVCAACGNKLFTSDAKFDSHCGWPSFDQSIEGSVKYVRDVSHGMIRTEVVCSQCEGHLGHIFEDGPKETTGNRYCMNSISLKFVPED